MRSPSAATLVTARQAIVLEPLALVSVTDVAVTLSWCGPLGAVKAGLATCRLSDA